MNFGRIMLNQNISKMQNCVTWIQMVLSFILKLKMFMNTLQMMLKKIFGTLNYEVNRPFHTEKNGKVTVLMKDELGRKIITEFVALGPKNYSYLMVDDGNSDKKTKGTKECVTK